MHQHQRHKRCREPDERIAKRRRLAADLLQKQSIQPAQHRPAQHHPNDPRPRNHPGNQRSAHQHPEIRFHQFPTPPQPLTDLHLVVARQHTRNQRLPIRCDRHRRRHHGWRRHRRRSHRPRAKQIRKLRYRRQRLPASHTVRLDLGLPVDPTIAEPLPNLLGFNRTILAAIPADDLVHDFPLPREPPPRHRLLAGLARTNLYGP